MKKILILLLSTVSLTLHAQQKELTVDDAVMKGRTSLAPAKLDQLAWIPATTKFSYVANKKLVVTDAATMKADSLNIWPEIQKQNSHITGTRFPQVNWVDSHTFYFGNKNNIYTYDLNTSAVKQIATFDSAFENIDVEKGSMNLAYTISSDLWVNVKGSNKRVATSEKDGIVYGKSVHREEYGIVKGTFWSPKGNKLAYYRMDESMVTQYPIYELQDKPAKARMIRYPMAGATSHHVDVMVYDVATDKSLKLDVSGPADQYLTNIAWSPDEKYVYIAVLNRATDHVWLNQYDAASGAFMKTLIEEANNTYEEPLRPIVFTPDGKYFLWQSQREGYNTYYKFDLEGKQVATLAPGILALDNVGFDEAGKNIFLQVVKPNSITKFCIKAGLNDGKYTVVETDTLNATPLASSKGDYVINQLSSLTLPREYDLVNAKNKSTVILKAPNPLADYKIGKIEIKTLKADDGTLLFTRTIYPYNFDATKKYPMVVYVYNGPHVQLITNSFNGGADLSLVYMANKGIIVYTVDGRGSGNRGFAFESIIYRNLGKYEMRDQMTGVNYMKHQPFIDSTRVGVDGWSFGGFMTISLFTRQPNQFKVAVAGGPVIDWSYYEVMYTERYMDTPQENPEGYKNSSLFNYIDNLKGKLLIIHGTSDNTVVWQHSLLYLQKCISKGKQLDYFVYPGAEHNVQGHDRVHLIEKITDYFVTNL